MINYLIHEIFFVIERKSGGNATILTKRKKLKGGQKDQWVKGKLEGEEKITTVITASLNIHVACQQQKILNVPCKSLP